METAVVRGVDGMRIAGDVVLGSSLRIASIALNGLRRPGE
jgi:hypothetical protein